MTASAEPFDVLIVGSGPAGYTAALYAARARLRVGVLEGSVAWGGALMTTTMVENYPGFRSGILGPDLMDEVREQAVRFGAQMIRRDAIAVDLDGGRKRVEDEEGDVHEADAVILSMGSAHRQLGLSSEQRLMGAGVSTCATCDGPFFGGKELAVVGGGDSALEEAVFLTRFASRVHVVHRRDRLRASRIMQERALANEQITFWWCSEVVEVLGERTVTGMRLRDVNSGREQNVPIGGVFVAIGHEPRSEIVRDQVACDSHGYVLVEHPSSRTSVPGVFAAGDILDPDYRQAVTAAGSGCRAALDAERYLASTEELAA